MSADRSIGVAGLANARDLGGLPRAGGGSTPTGVFVRSERPDLVDDDGWRRLGVRTVVDLRQPGERAADRRPPPAGVAVRHVDHDGLAGHPEFWTGYWETGLVGTPLYYLPHLAALPERTVAVLAAIATAPPGPVLFHCAGGRDRTGLIAAVLLAAAGVEEDAIVGDYLQSVANGPALASLRGTLDVEPEVAAFLAERGTDSAAAFRAFLRGLDLEGLLGALRPEDAEAIRSWRGGLPA